MPGRNFNAPDYRFGFNGMEKDDEWTGVTGSHLAFKYRTYDSRIGRFFSVDPLTKDYPHWTPYQFAGLTPIWAIELEGLEPGKPFKSAEASFLNYATIYGKMSIQEKREYGTMIYKYTDKHTKETVYTYNVPRRGSKTQVMARGSNLWTFWRGKRVAGAHSHGAYDVKYESNVFSETDIEGAEESRRDEYLSTPSGKGLLYEYKSKTESEISTNLPSDPADPEAPTKSTNYAYKLGWTKEEKKAQSEANKELRKEYKKEYKEYLKERRKK